MDTIVSSTVPSKQHDPATRDRVRAAHVRAYGAPPELAEMPVPERGPGQALVHVTAAALNYFDLWVASGTYPGFAPSLPYVPGAEGVGRVLAGDRLAPGTRVWWRARSGAFADRVVIQETSAVPLPEALAYDLAACLGVAGTSVWLSFTDMARLSPGETVLVLGASGGVGQFAIQVARLLGAGRVVAASRDSAGLTTAAELGADATVRQGAPETFVDDLRAAAPTGYDVVIDPVWGAPAAAAVEAMAPRGRLVTLGLLAGPIAPLSGTVLARGLSIFAYNSAFTAPGRVSAAYSELATHAAAGRLTVEREVAPLADVAELWRRQGASPRRKLVLTP